MTIVRYGGHESQFCEVTGEGEPTVVLLHGGFWRARYGLDLMRPMAADFAARGWAVANVEYRRVGDGGGFPATLEDVAAACRALIGPLVAVGHSAGGHLALWLAGEGLVAAAVSLCGVCCLEEGARDRLGRGAVEDFMGGSTDWARADPRRRLPTGVPTVLIHGTRDRTVPVRQSRRYAEAAGDECTLAEYPGGHFEVIEPGSIAWPSIVSAVEQTTR